MAALPPDQSAYLLHLYAAIQEADRLMQPFRQALSLKPRAIGMAERQAVTPLDASLTYPNLFYKREDQTVIRAYKTRGAFCGMRRVMDTMGEQHFLAVSTGNHALGVLKAAELLRPQTVKIVVPNNTSDTKLRQINSKLLGIRHKGVDATVLTIGDTFDEARQWALEQQLIGDGYYLDPYSNPWVVAGQGTIGLEIYRQLLPVLAVQPNIKEIVLIGPVGGGGLLAGSATALTFASAYDARFANITLKVAGLRLQNLSTKYGDAVRVKLVAAVNEQVFEALGVHHLKMNDELMASGMLAVHGDMGDKVEGPCGATLATALQRPAEYGVQPDRIVVCILSGGNVSVWPGGSGH
jgi:threonine dehydratase